MVEVGEHSFDQVSTFDYFVKELRFLANIFKFLDFLKNIKDKYIWGREFNVYKTLLEYF